MSIKSGKYREFYWLQTDDFGQKDVIEQCTNFLLGKYLAVTAFDSGEPNLSSEEIQAGWKMNLSIAYSPKLDNMIIAIIPYAGFDEWFFLEDNTVITVEEDYVNYALFDLCDERMPKNFWNQIYFNCPYAYVADGMQLTVVSKDVEMMEALRALSLTLHSSIGGDIK